LAERLIGRAREPVSKPGVRSVARHSQWSFYQFPLQYSWWFAVENQASTEEKLGVDRNPSIKKIVKVKQHNKVENEGIQ
jgi:hypothetical protein